MTRSGSTTKSTPRESPTVKEFFDFVKFRKLFERAYDQFYGTNRIDLDLLNKINEHSISMEQFDTLTIHKKQQRYISLIDGKIRFDEVPNRPHGELISLIQALLSQEFQELSENAVLIGCADNGMILSIKAI